MSASKSQLAKIDTFVENVSDETSRTSLGGIFTLLIPVACAAYAAYMVARTNNEPPIQSVVRDMAFKNAFNLSVTCNARKGCLMTLNYEGQSSQMCKKSIEAAYPNYFAREWSNKCRQLAYEEEIIFPVCYTADPIDGPHFMWERQQNCSMDQSFSSGDKKQNVLQPSQDCRAGVALKASFINPGTGVVTGPLLLPLFYGTHVLTVEDITAKLFSTDTRALQNAPVQVSDQSYVSSTSPCCNGQLSCAAGANSGQVNDHYSLFDRVTIYREELYSLVLSALGSIYSVVVTVFGTILLFYRKLFRSSKVSSNPKLSASQPAYAIQTTAHV